MRKVGYDRTLRRTLLAFDATNWQIRLSSTGELAKEKHWWSNLKTASHMRAHMRRLR